MLRWISPTFSRFFSMKTAREAPRLSASSPTAPVPANRSTAIRPGIKSPTMLKIDSRTRSLVGRMSALGRGPSILCPRRCPAMIRMARRIPPFDQGSMLDPRGPRAGRACSHT